MGLYEAIDILDEFFNKESDNSDTYYIIGSEEWEAIKICLEAAKDKAGV